VTIQANAASNRARNEPFRERLVDRVPILLVLLLSLAACAKGDVGPAAPSPPAMLSLEQQTHSRINAYRASKGLPSLTWSDVIANQARRHSQSMASGKTRFGHGGFRDRLAIIGRSIQWSHGGENAAISRTASGAVAVWLKSRGHRKEIEGKFNLTGIGAARAANGSVYFTQIFIDSK
jgi:uncharacterized protein YkwD